MGARARETSTRCQEIRSMRLAASSILLASLFAAFFAMAAQGNAIKHSYILSLDANTPKDTRDSIVASLESNGAKPGRQITNIIDYPDIMQAIAYEDVKAAEGQVQMESDEARIESWKTSLRPFGDKIVAVEQDQVVSTQEA